jgi:hypothetical protein
MRFRTLLAIALFAAAARASNVSNEITVNSTQATDTNPRSGSVGDSLSGSIDLSDLFTLNLGATLTTQNSAPSPIPNESGSAAVPLLNLGLDWTPTESITIGLSGEWSPQVTSFADAPLALATTTGTAHIRSLSSEAGGGLDLSYDTSGDSALEWSFSGGVHFTHWNIDQTIPRVTTANGTDLAPPQVVNEINTYCSRHPALKNCGTKVKRELTATPFVLNSIEYSAGATAIVLTDTDLTLSADIYDYAQDPKQEAYASLIFNGRGGAGVPVAPLRYMIKPEVAHRFGDFSVKAWVQAGEYVQNTGGTTSGAGIKLQYKFSKSFRMWARLLGTKDVDDQGNESKSGAFSLGAGYRF